MSNDRLILEPYMLPSEASKTISIEGNPIDKNDEDAISQWVWASVVYHFKDQESVSGEELDDAIHLFYTQQMLDSLTDKGLVEAIWSEEKGEIVYAATEAAKKALENEESRRDQK